MRHTWQTLIRATNRSRLLTTGVTVVAWFVVSGMLGALAGALHGRRYPFLVYVYNAFTIFSNLGDDLGLALGGGGGAAAGMNLPLMAVNLLLVVSGMIGIALLTAVVTKNTIDLDERKFDACIDDFRRLTVIATSQRADAHRILAGIIQRIHREIVPARTNTSVHSVNIYEFEYLVVHVIGRIMRARRLLRDEPEAYRVYSLQQVEEIVAWAETLDDLTPLFGDPSPSLVNRQFQRAWRLFALELPERIRTWQLQALGEACSGVPMEVRTMEKTA